MGPDFFSSAQLAGFRRFRWFETHLPVTYVEAVASKNDPRYHKPANGCVSGISSSRCLHLPTTKPKTVKCLKPEVRHSLPGMGPMGLFQQKNSQVQNHFSCNPSSLISTIGLKCLATGFLCVQEPIAVMKLFINTFGRRASTFMVES